MGRLRAAAVLVSVLVVVPPPLEAQAFRSLGFLAPASPTRYSQAHDVSGDGTTVVGESDGQAFRWTTGAYTTLQPLGSLPGGTTSKAYGVSANGGVVVGAGEVPGGTHAFRWTQGTGMADLGALAGAYSAALACSAEGSVVAGESQTASGVRAFRWTQGGGMTALPALPFPGKDSHAWGVSADGGVVVGRSGCCENTGAVMAVRWTQATSFAVEGLGDLPGTAPESPWGAAAGISADGQVIVGGGGAPSLAFRWTGGAMTALAPTTFPLPHDPVSAMDASGNGSVIVGAAATASGIVVSTPVGPVPGARAFIWTAADGIRDLNQVLKNLGLASSLTGWTLEIGTAVSDDGNIIAGYGTHDGRPEAWVAALSGDDFPSTLPDEPSPPGLRRSLKVFVAGLRESHGFLWSPSKGPRPIAPDPPPFVTADLLAFGLTPAEGGEQVDGIAFHLEDVGGVERDQWSDVALVVDANGNGTVDPREIATVAGPGYADAIGRLVFLKPFRVEGPTRYVLRAGITGLGRDARVTVALREDGIAARSAAIEGSALRRLTVEEPPRELLPTLMAALLVALLAVAVLMLRRSAKG